MAAAAPQVRGALHRRKEPHSAEDEAKMRTAFPTFLLLLWINKCVGKKETRSLAEFLNKRVCACWLGVISRPE